MANPYGSPLPSYKQPPNLLYKLEHLIKASEKIILSSYFRELENSEHMISVIEAKGDIKRAIKKLENLYEEITRSKELPTRGGETHTAVPRSNVVDGNRIREDDNLFDCNRTSSGEV